MTDGDDGSAAERHPVMDVFLGTGARIAGTVYGTIVVAATLTAAYATQKDPWRLALLVATTALVLWVGHIYSHTLAESIRDRQRLSVPRLLVVAHRELGILLAAIAPVAALVLGAIEVLRESRAVWLALGIALLTLAVEGFRYARLERLGPAGTFIAVAGNLAVGLLVILLKVLIAH